MSRRRTRNVTAAPSPIDDLLLPYSGPNAVPPEKMTPRERREEIISILACAFLRRAAGMQPFAKSPPTG